MHFAESWEMTDWRGSASNRQDSPMHAKKEGGTHRKGHDDAPLHSNHTTTHRVLSL